MSEIPKFLNGIDPAMILEMQQEMAATWDEQELKTLEAYRQDVLNMLAYKTTIIEQYFFRPSLDAKLSIEIEDNIVRSHLLYYLDKIFDASPKVNKSAKLTEVLFMADASQEQINLEMTGNSLINGAGEWRTIVAGVLQEDDPSTAKQDVIGIYDRQLRRVVLEFVRVQ